MIELFFFCMYTKARIILLQGLWFIPVSQGLVYKWVSHAAWDPPNLLLVLTLHCRAELLHWLVGEAVIAPDIINYK